MVVLVVRNTAGGYVFLGTNLLNTHVFFNELFPLFTQYFQGLFPIASLALNN